MVTAWAGTREKTVLPGRVPGRAERAAEAVGEKVARDARGSARLGQLFPPRLRWRAPRAAEREFLLPVGAGPVLPPLLSLLPSP